MNEREGEDEVWKENRKATPPITQQQRSIYTILDLTESDVSFFKLTHSDTDYCLHFKWVLSTFLLSYMTSPCLSFIQLFASIWLHGDPFVFVPHPVQKGQTDTKKR